MRPQFLLAFCAVILLAAGCGVGAGRQFQRTTLGPPAASLTRADTSFSLTSNRVMLYDTSGALLAGIASAGNAASAQQRAEEDARERGAVVGDTYGYSYDVVPPVPGRMTTFSVGWGSSEPGSISNTDTDLLAKGVSFLEMDLTTGLATWFIEDGPDLGITLGANYQSWTIGDGRSQPRIAMPFDVTAGMLLHPRIHLAARVGVDTLFFFNAWLGDYWVDYSAGAHLAVGLFSWLQLHCDASYLRTTVDTGEREARQFQANVNLVFAFDPETWMDD